MNWSREHEDIPSLSLYLYGVFEELLPVVRVPGVDVGPRQDGSGAILLGEISDKNHNLKTHHVCWRQIHTSINTGPEMTIVRIVKMRVLSSLVRKDCVS